MGGLGEWGNKGGGKKEEERRSGKMESGDGYPIMPFSRIPRITNNLRPFYELLLFHLLMKWEKMLQRFTASAMDLQ